MDKKVRTFWIYTIILFSAAFVIILLSAISGVRYNDYKEESENLYSGAQKSLINLTNENEALRAKIAEKDEEVAALTLRVSELEEKMGGGFEKYRQSVDALIRARALVRDGKFSKAAEEFAKVNTAGFSDELMEIYNYVKGKI